MTDKNEEAQAAAVKYSHWDRWGGSGNEPSEKISYRAMNDFLAGAAWQKSRAQPPSTSAVEAANEAWFNSALEIRLEEYSKIYLKGHQRAKAEFEGMITCKDAGSLMSVGHELTKEAYEKELEKVKAEAAEEIREIEEKTNGAYLSQIREMAEKIKGLEAQLDTYDAEKARIFRELREENVRLEALVAKYGRKIDMAAEIFEFMHLVNIGHLTNDGVKAGSDELIKKIKEFESKESALSQPSAEVKAPLLEEGKCK